MTEKQLQDIASQAIARWSLSSVSIIHRIGKLAPSEQIVFVGVASMHRQAAFEACQFVMDILKTHATFWKKEHFANSEKWVKAKASDSEVAKRW